MTLYREAAAALFRQDVAESTQASQPGKPVQAGQPAQTKQTNQTSHACQACQRGRPSQRRASLALFLDLDPGEQKRGEASGAPGKLAEASQASNGQAQAPAAPSRSRAFQPPLKAGRELSQRDGARCAGCARGNARPAAPVPRQFPGLQGAARRPQAQMQADCRQGSARRSCRRQARQMAKRQMPAAMQPSPLARSAQSRPVQSRPGQARPAQTCPTPRQAPQAKPAQTHPVQESTSMQTANSQTSSQTSPQPLAGSAAPAGAGQTRHSQEAPQPGSTAMRQGSSQNQLHNQLQGQPDARLPWDREDEELPSLPGQSGMSGQEASAPLASLSRQRLFEQDGDELFGCVIFDDGRTFSGWAALEGGDALRLPPQGLSALPGQGRFLSNLSFEERRDCGLGGGFLLDGGWLGTGLARLLPRFGIELAEERSRACEFLAGLFGRTLRLGRKFVDSLNFLPEASLKKGFRIRLGTARDPLVEEPAAGALGNALGYYVHCQGRVSRGRALEFSLPMAEHARAILSRPLPEGAFEELSASQLPGRQAGPGESRQWLAEASQDGMRPVLVRALVTDMDARSFHLAGLGEAGSLRGRGERKMWFTAEELAPLLEGCRVRIFGALRAASASLPWRFLDALAMLPPGSVLSPAMQLCALSLWTGAGQNAERAAKLRSGSVRMNPAETFVRGRDLALCRAKAAEVEALGFEVAGYGLGCVSVAGEGWRADDLLALAQKTGLLPPCLEGLDSWPAEEASGHVSGHASGQAAGLPPAGAAFAVPEAPSFAACRALAGAPADAFGTLMRHAAATGEGALGFAQQLCALGASPRLETADVLACSLAPAPQGPASARPAGWQGSAA